MLSPGTILQSRYRIVRQFGQGGMGAVYEAVDGRLNSLVAIKETFAVNEDGERAFRQEAQLLANLSHHALPKVTDYLVEGGGQFLVMEFISGEDFKQILERRDAPFTFNELRPLIDKVSEALEYLHSCSPPVVHRDIKPSNIKLTEDGKIYLLDFGLAKGLIGQMSTLQASSVHGYTLNYAPPEQIQNKGTDVRSDVYALGATLYHLMTRTPPPDAITRLSEISLGRPDVLVPADQISAGVPPGLSGALTRAMALEPNMRPSSVAELLSLFLNDRPETTQQRSEAKVPAQLCSKNSGVSYALAFSHNGKMLASGMYHGLIEVWDVTTGNLLQTLTGHRDMVLALAFSPSDNKLASGAADGSLIVWNVKTGARIWQHGVRNRFSILREVFGFRKSIYSIKFSDNGKLLASGYGGGFIEIWDVQTGQLLKSIGLPRYTVGNITALDFEHKRMVAGSSEGYICMADVETGKPLWYLKGHDKCVKYICHSDDGILSGGMDSIKKWKPKYNTEAELVQTWGESREDVNCIDFSAQREFMATGSDDGVVHFFNMKYGYEFYSKAGEYEESIACVALSPNSKVIASGSLEKPYIRLTETEHLACRKIKPGHLLSDAGLQ